MMVDVCQKIFSTVTLTILHSLPLFLLTLILIILFTGLVALMVQIVKTRAFIKRNSGKRMNIYNLNEILKDLNLIGKLDIVKNKNKFTFCYGLLRPRIALSTTFLKTLTKDELKAVLLHESYHLKNHDPFKILLGKTVSLMFFFIPIFRDIQRYYSFCKEIAADEVVIRNGHKYSLISVLSKLMASPSPAFAGVAALTNINDLEKRILYLSGKKPKFTFKPSIANIFISVLVVVFSLIIVNAPVYAVNIEENSLDHTLFICPKEVNFSKNILYTPKDNDQ